MCGMLLTKFWAGHYNMSFYLLGIVLLSARLIEFDTCNFENVTRLDEVRLKLLGTR